MTLPGGQGRGHVRADGTRAMGTGSSTEARLDLTPDKFLTDSEYDRLLLHMR